MAAPQAPQIPDLDEKQIGLVLHSLKNPEDPGSQEVIEWYKANSSPHYEGNVLVQPKFRAIDPELLKAAEPEGAGTKLKKAAQGAAIGAFEVVNPLSIPHSLETLGRAGYKYATSDKGLLDSLSEANKESITAPMTFRQLAPIGKSLIQAPFSNKSLTDVYEENVAAQEKFQSDPFVAGGQTATELGGALWSLGKLAAQSPKFIRGAKDTLLKLKGTNAMLDAVGSRALTPKEVVEANRLRSQLVGDLPPELKKALDDNTSQIRALIEGPQENLSAKAVVDGIRKSVSDNQTLLGEAVGELRKTIVSKNPQKFDTSLMVQKLDDFEKSQVLSGGQSVLNPKEAQLLGQFKSLLRNSGKKGSDYTFDTRDATVMIDKFDDYLKKQGFYDGKNNTLVNQQIFGLRNSMDEEVAALYPAFKSVKLQYSDFLNDYSKMQNRIESMNAEGFVSNLYGRNKTETREVLENILNKGKRTADEFKNISNDPGYLSKSNKVYNKAIEALQKKAEGIKFPEGRAVMNDIANKAVARRLVELTDKDLDITSRLMDQFVSQKVAAAEKAAEAYSEAASTGAGTLAGWLTSKVGGLMEAGAVGGATKYLTKGPAKAIVKGLQGDVEKMAVLEAEQLYSVPNLLKAIEQSKKVSQETKELGNGLKFVLNKYGEASADSFFKSVKATPQLVKDLDALYPNVKYGVMGAQGVAKGGPDARNFANDVLNFEGATITPSETKPSKEFQIQRGK